MKKAIGIILLSSLCPGFIFCQAGAESLVQQAADHLQAFFLDKTAARAAIVQFENHSQLSDTAMQKLYQLLTARLESDKNIKASDLLLNFTGGRGDFNLSRMNELDYLIHLRFIQNKSRAGMGVAVFSRWQDSLVSLKYFETVISPAEMDFLNVAHSAFTEMGFSTLGEFECRENLLDVRSIALEDGPNHYYFYYPDEVIIYAAREGRLDKEASVTLRWSRPYYPVQHFHGKLLLFTLNQTLIMTVGGNFSPYAQVLTFSGGQWRETAKIDFVPMKHLIFNGSPYLAGGRYEEGRNYFKDRLYFMLFNDPAASSDILEKKAAAAHDIAFSTENGHLQGIHLIDMDYRYRLWTSDLAEKTPLAEKKGANLAADEGQWLAISDYSRRQDRLFFYDLKSGGHRPVYSGKVDGEIQFISAGTWQGSEGFWACVRVFQEGFDRLMLQFWGKRHE
jgi:hypothetical protein